MNKDQECARYESLVSLVKAGQNISEESVVFLDMHLDNCQTGYHSLDNIKKETDIQEGIGAYQRGLERTNKRLEELLDKLRLEELLDKMLGKQK